jgi:nicotinate phosphoribosyltransferase
VRLVVDLKKRLDDRFPVGAVRLDSRDLGTLARATRRILDEAGLGKIPIFASSGLDEYQLARLVESGAPIDGFGVGTKLAVCVDAPKLDMAYKLVEYSGKGRCKFRLRRCFMRGASRSSGEFRGSQMCGDVIGGFNEELPGIGLLRPVMLGGRIQTLPDHEESRRHAAAQVSQIDERQRFEREESGRSDPEYIMAKIL